MAQLRQEYQKFAERNTEIIAIGPEDAKSFADWWHSEHMPFPGIPDPEHIIAKMYGQQVKLLKLGRMPAMIVLDMDGKIRYRHYGKSMSDIPLAQEILSLLDEINNEREAKKGKPKNNRVSVTNNGQPAKDSLLMQDARTEELDEVSVVMRDGYLAVG